MPAPCLARLPPLAGGPGLRFRLAAPLPGAHAALGELPAHALGASGSGPQFTRSFPVREVTVTWLEEEAWRMDWLVVGAQLVCVKRGKSR